MSPLTDRTILRTTFRRHVTFAIIPAIVTLCVVGAALLANRQALESRKLLAHARDVISESNLLLQRVTDAETGVRAFVATGDPLFLQPYTGAEADARGHLSAVRRLTIDNPVQAERTVALDSAVTQLYSSLLTVLETRRTKGVQEAATQFFVGKQRMDTLRNLVSGIQTEENRLLEERTAHSNELVQLRTAIIGFGGAIAILVSLLANRALARKIIQLGHANVELEEQAHRLEEQATELETQATELEATAAELEAANVELEEAAVELEEQRDTAQAARADAEQANAAKSRFLSTMSHELRTPLNAVTGYVDLMDAGVHGPVTPEQREDIRRIKRAVSQLTSVINDILNFAKLEAGEVRFRMGPMHMHEALANASALMEPQAEAKGIRFDYMPCDPALVAFGDRERVQQVVLNLLSNAVKYTDVGGAVTMGCMQRDDMVVVTVADTGRGIAGDDLRRIFDPFVQILGSVHSPSDGVGLGLAIGRDLARGMGGDITVRSEAGRGSTFEFSLRVTPASPVDAEDDADDAFDALGSGAHV